MKCKLCKGIGTLKCSTCNGHSYDNLKRKCTDCQEGIVPCTECEGVGRVPGFFSKLFKKSS